MSYNSSIFNLQEMMGARSLFNACGNYKKNKPIIAVVNSYTSFVPGHIHLQEIGKIVVKELEKLGVIAKEFNTIAICDGIAMGHEGMLYSLPSREIIANSVEYMCKAHKVDGMICISNCDKITPGMLMASMRLNIPTVFVSGGPMEAGSVNNQSADLVDAMVASGKNDIDKKELDGYEQKACPTCGSCSGMFTANSMNCLVEAIGLGLPGNGTLLATHKNRKKLFIQSAKLIVKNVNKYYLNNDSSVLPRNIATKYAFINAMSLDIAMGGSTNTILHLLAIANEAKVNFTLKDIDKLSKNIPVICKVSPNSKYHIEDVHRAGGISGILLELDKKKLLHRKCKTITGKTIYKTIKQNDIVSDKISKRIKQFYLSAPGKIKTHKAFKQNCFYSSYDLDRVNGCIRSIENAYFKEGGLVVLKGNLAKDGCVIKVAGIEENLFYFKGKAIVFDSQEEACKRILARHVKEGDIVIIRYEGPKGGPGMQEMLYPTSFLKSVGLGKKCALITDGRFSGGTSGLSIGHISPEASEGGLLAYVKDGDMIEIDIKNRKIELLVDEKEILKRKKEIKLHPKRDRLVPKSLEIYAKNVSNASKGAILE